MATSTQRPGVCMNELHRSRKTVDLRSQGGAEGIAKQLGSDANRGLPWKQVPKNRKEYGDNADPAAASCYFRAVMFSKLRNLHIAMMIVGCLAAICDTLTGEPARAISVVQGLVGWVLITILGPSVMIASELITTLSMFRKFQQQNPVTLRKHVTVLRDGQEVAIKRSHLVVGDVLFLNESDTIPADGVILVANGLVVDETLLSAERKQVAKDATTDPWVRCGTRVVKGIAQVLVLAVGENTEWGGACMSWRDAKKVSSVATNIENLYVKLFVFGLGLAVVLIIQWLVRLRDAAKYSSSAAELLLYVATIEVAAVPQGLPLFRSSQLDYVQSKMGKVAVRQPFACENLGAVSAICVDVEGPITNGSLVVQKVLRSDGSSLPLDKGMAQLHPKLGCTLGKCSIVAEAHPDVTLSASMGMRRSMGIVVENDDQLRGACTLHQTTDSSRTVVVANVNEADGSRRLYAAMSVRDALSRCAHVLLPDGKIARLGKRGRKKLENVLKDTTNKGMRAVGLCYRDLAASDTVLNDAAAAANAMVLVAVLVVESVIRDNAAGAVAACRRANIDVYMMTAYPDRDTAVFVAREVGLLQEQDGDPGRHVVMDAATFFAMEQSQQIDTLSSLKVLTGCKGKHKAWLIELLQKQGHVVAVVGESRKSLKALMKADVGVTTCTADTAVVKVAADVILQDNNYLEDVVEAIMWGRYFQQTLIEFVKCHYQCNIDAMIFAFVCAIWGGVEPTALLVAPLLAMLVPCVLKFQGKEPEPSRELREQRPRSVMEPLIPRGTRRTLAVRHLFLVIAAVYGYPLWKDIPWGSFFVPSLSPLT
ncbi:hypothetical protein PLESTB_001633000 [Pleodorina starrii]|uniref:Uncharacterized protein n=1 Tax=Pleodorina starrii TaxID=330485 RepID=A0A9W6BZ99_9CHLO|nr:hypothetical protein PLESTM_001030600 [Pleodorina starrii]GLC60605.1 hypothetical protein PLESTB_001633000 [Pleodorina starrii]GLC76661.1 hypothetical protein PLESTF_001814400 [Pleodorina starrii]